MELRARAQLDDRGPRQGAHLHLDEGGVPRRLPQREELRLPQRRVQLRHSAGTAARFKAISCRAVSFLKISRSQNFVVSIDDKSKRAF